MTVRIDPPFCCQPPMSDEVWEETGRRLKAAYAESISRQPKVCPLCASEQIVPTFRAPTEWFCDDCDNVWRQADGG